MWNPGVYVWSRVGGIPPARHSTEFVADMEFVCMTWHRDPGFATSRLVAPQFRREGTE